MSKNLKASWLIQSSCFVPSPILGIGDTAVTTDPRLRELTGGPHQVNQLIKTVLTSVIMETQLGLWNTEEGTPVREVDFPGMCSPGE